MVKMAENDDFLEKKNDLKNRFLRDTNLDQRERENMYFKSRQYTYVQS